MDRVREDFEKWVVEGLGGLIARVILKMANPDMYHSNYTQVKWEAWQAATAAANARHEEKSDVVDDEGWMDWEGGECPVSDFSAVDARFRDGLVVNERLACLWVWKHHDDDDIITYRLSREE